MFTKILIANRGEIACRVIQTARKLGIHCVAVYSDADKNALHVSLADEAYRIGPEQVSQSYLRIDKIIEIARSSGAQAIHPGYGFLSENPDFVSACQAAGCVFIGPPVEAIKAMGLKDAAKTIMERSGVPVVPGYHGDDQDVEHLQAQSEKIGYPVLIKARAGGGGKGMRLVNTAGEFIHALDSAKREALSSFGDERVIIEKFISAPRHIEVQVFADQHGNTVHLFERDCSMQRRHQKVIEEAPAQGMSESMRTAMGEAAVRAAQAVNYVGAGTVEFIVDSTKGLDAGAFYFMEMNTRLQVEHPVTEAITGHDLVQWQLAVAAGEPLPKTQQELSINGHAFEARIYAEDSSNNFMPATGRLNYLSLPDEPVRVDSGVRQGDRITPFYDPMIAKVIVHGSSRNNALGNLQRALAETHIVGCVTNVDFLIRLSKHRDFANGLVDTGLIERNIDQLSLDPDADENVIALAALSSLGYLSKTQGDDPWQCFTGWRHFSAARQYTHQAFGQDEIEVMLMTHSDQSLELVVDGKTVVAKSLSIDGHRVSVDFNDRIFKATVVEQDASVTIFIDSNSYRFDLPDNTAGLDSVTQAENVILAPMPGLITAVHVEQGQSVTQGEVLIVMEAMKMEHSLRAAVDGVVEQLNAAKNDQVQEGTMLLKIEQA